MTSKQSYDVILAGGGVMGCSTAYFLLKDDPTIKVLIIEKDLTYEKASTILSDGNIRIQFDLKENIQISQFGFQMLDKFADEMAVGDKRPDVAARHQGNLFLVTEAGREQALAAVELQKQLGCAIEWLSVEEIESRYPLFKAKDCVGGTLGSLDGSVDPNAVLMGYKDKALAMGVDYLQAEVKQITRNESSVTGIQLSDGRQITAKVVVNTAGAWAADLARTCGIEIPVIPVRRQVFIVDTKARPDGFLPSLFMPTGLYLIHENASHFMVGKSFDDDPVGYDFNWSPDRFMESMWEELIDYVPSFEELKVLRGWAGLYAVNTLDGNAILGEWTQLKGAYLANGFSGHGFQQCHAVGRYLAELILGIDVSLDLSIFSPLRILENRPVLEGVSRII